MTIETETTRGSTPPFCAECFTDPPDHADDCTWGRVDTSDYVRVTWRGCTLLVSPTFMRDPSVDVLTFIEHRLADPTPAPIALPTDGPRTGDA